MSNRLLIGIGGWDFFGGGRAAIERLKLSMFGQAIGTPRTVHLLAAAFLPETVRIPLRALNASNQFDEIQQVFFHVPFLHGSASLVSLILESTSRCTLSRMLVCPVILGLRSLGRLPVTEFNARFRHGFRPCQSVFRSPSPRQPHTKANLFVRQSFDFPGQGA